MTDPLLGGLGPLRRRHPPPDTEALAGADAILISHQHHDHLHLGSLRRLAAPIVAPRGAARRLRERGFADVSAIAVGETLAVGGAAVTAVPADHGAGRIGGGRDDDEALGYLIEAGGARVYFAGDTDLFAGMAELAPLDLALLPIWGWGPRLGPGHLDPERAARALGLLRPRIAVPIHHGTLSLPGSGRLWPWLLTRPAERFAAEAARLAPEVEVRALRPLETTGLR